jgi:hypothetical protein
MTGKSLRVQNAIAFALLFGLGAFILLVSGYDFYHWYATGNLYAPSKYDHHGRYVSYGETPGLFLAACAKSLIGAVAGIVFIVQAFRAPSEFREKQQARLASLKKSPPHHWQAGWHAILSVGGFVIWLLWHLLSGFLAPSDGGRTEAERRGRERIMESYDKYDRRNDDD